MLELLVPRLSGFDRLGVTENGHVLGGEEHLDAARDAWLAADVAEALQREDHLVHGRRAELERALHVGLSWRKVTVTEHRTARDYAKRLRELVEITLAILLSSGGRCTGETVSRLEAATMAATRAMRPSSTFP